MTNQVWAGVCVVAGVVMFLLGDLPKRAAIDEYRDLTDMCIESLNMCTEELGHSATLAVHTAPHTFDPNCYVSTNISVLEGAECVRRLQEQIEVHTTLDSTHFADIFVEQVLQDEGLLPPTGELSPPNGEGGTSDEE